MTEQTIFLAALDVGDPTQLGVPDQRGVVRRGGVNVGAYQASAFVLTAPATAGSPFNVRTPRFRSPVSEATLLA
jgi:hypothetical protein